MDTTKPQAPLSLPHNRDAWRLFIVRNSSDDGPPSLLQVFSLYHPREDAPNMLRRDFLRKAEEEGVITNGCEYVVMFEGYRQYTGSDTWYLSMTVERLTATYQATYEEGKLPASLPRSPKPPTV